MADPRTVLVVEDDRAIRDLLQTVLEASGLAVRTAGDGLEGLLKVQVHRPDLIVLDLMMPDVGGIRVLDQLAAEHAGTPVLVVTGSPEGAAQARERLGADRVLTKPFDVDDLAQRVVALLEVST